MALKISVPLVISLAPCDSAACEKPGRGCAKPILAWPIAKMASCCRYSVMRPKWRVHSRQSARSRAACPSKVISCLARPRNGALRVFLARRAEIQLAQQKEITAAHLIIDGINELYEKASRMRASKMSCWQSSRRRRGINASAGSSTYVVR